MIDMVNMINISTQFEELNRIAMLLATAARSRDATDSVHDLELQIHVMLQIFERDYILQQPKEQRT